MNSQVGERGLDPEPTPFSRKPLCFCEKRTPWSTSNHPRPMPSLVTELNGLSPAPHGPGAHVSHTVPLSLGPWKADPGYSLFALSPSLPTLLCPSLSQRLTPTPRTPSPSIPCALASGWDQPKGNTGRRSKGKGAGGGVFLPYLLPH